VVDVLTPYANEPDAIRCELLLELGHGLCRLHREKPSSAEYLRGKGYLEESVGLCEASGTAFVPHLRRRESVHARALACLAWALTGIRGQGHEARKRFRMAHEHEPGNPYFLAAMLGFEMRFVKQAGLVENLTTTIRGALGMCREHALASIELPYAYFTAGRFSLLLGQGHEALGYYARGIRYCLEGTHCLPGGLLAEEENWIRDAHDGEQLPPECQRVVDLLQFGSVPIGHGGAPSMTRPVLIVAGGAASLAQELADRIRPLLKTACEKFRGSIVSGGTTSGVPGCIGDAAAELAAGGNKSFRLIGYLPRKLPQGTSAHAAYDEQITVGEDFVPEQILRNWSDIRAAGIEPRDVLLLGFGGGALSAVEYRIALGLGASVGVVAGTGGAADALLADPLWRGVPNLFPLPFDTATVRAFVVPSTSDIPPDALEAMGKVIHQKYVAGSSKRLPPNMRPWDQLALTYQKANREQAHYSVAILEAAGFEVRKAAGEPAIFADFTPAEVDRMAELEHGRWNAERLRDGWRYGKRNDARKLHDCLVSWRDLAGDIREYDKTAVRDFPAILAKAGLEVVRARAAR
jgi:hypothetical protein